jgi:hypothetical protein
MTFLSLFLILCTPSLARALSTPAQAIVSGQAVVIKPYNISFSLPASWLEWQEQFHNNIHSSRRELHSTKYAEGEWDFEYARIVNALIPYNTCVLHAGGEAWGRRSVSFGDLQVRLYLGDFHIEQVESDVRTHGSRIAQKLGKNVEVTRDQLAGWPRVSLTYDLWFDDYGGKARIDFCLRRVNNVSTLFVLMYCSDVSSKQIKEGESILLSVQPSGAQPAH